MILINTFALINFRIQEMDKKRSSWDSFPDPSVSEANP